MNKSNQTKIGNENFKHWLKKLDPVSRVEKMSAIAKTQASAGLRGSLIKASLAQLSQRCQVMLMRLTEEEIRRNTRRKNVEGLPSVTITEQSSIQTVQSAFANQKRETAQDFKPDSYTKIKFLNGCQRSSENTECTISKPIISTNEGSPAVKIPHNKALLLKSASGFEKPLSSKKIKQIKELFGDDTYENMLPKTTSIKLSGIVQENIVNNRMCTAETLKEYKSTYNNSPQSKSSLIKRKTEENSIIPCDGEKFCKQVRYNGSVSVKGSDSINAKDTCDNSFKFIKDSTSLNSKQDKVKKGNIHKSSKKYIQKSKNKSKSHKKDKPAPTPLNIKSISPEEDPSIKELWSILGMESPTDRSESIIKSYPLSSSEKTITLHRASPEKNGHTLVPQEILPQPMKDDCQIKNKPAVDQLKTSVFEGEGNTANDLLNDADSQIPVCKIAETFSLAHTISTISRFPDSNSKLSPEKVMDTVMDTSISKPTLNKVNQVKPIEINDNQPQLIETISILDDDDENEATAKDMCNGVQKTNANERSKVGTIRVKNLGLLMDSHNLNNCVTNNEANPSQPCNVSLSTQTNGNIGQAPRLPAQGECSSPGKPQSVEESFFNIYNFYFNELVESKIPKLGELLHLAVADGIRRDERIKRAEQLSSDDLIKEEKQRADKDFNDMMKVRGSEFSPLCQIILNKFDQSSKITLFIALFCRILKHAGEIDSSNKNYFIEARDVIFAMLAKHQFRDREVTTFLQSDPEIFKKHVRFISVMIDKNHTMKNGLKTTPQSPTSLTSLNTAPNMDSTNISDPISFKSKETGIHIQRLTKNSQVTKITIPQQMHTLQINATQAAIKKQTQHNIVSGLSHSVSQQNHSITENNSSLPVCPTSFSLAFVSVPNGTSLPADSLIPLSTFPQITNVTSNHFSQPTLRKIVPAAVTNLGGNNIVSTSSMLSLNLYPQSVMTIAGPKQASPINTTKKITANSTPSFSEEVRLNSKTTTQDKTHITVSKLASRLSTVNTPKISQWASVLKRNIKNDIETSGLNRKTQDQAHVIEKQQNIITVPKTGHRPNIIRENNKSSEAFVRLNPSSPNIIRENNKSSEAFVRLNPSSLIVAKNNESSKIQHVANITLTAMGPPTPSEPVSQNIEVAMAAGENNGRNQSVLLSASTTITPRRDELSLTSLLKTSEASQGPVPPSSSHCHPFIRRMPISGKMRMLFEK